MNCRKMGEKIYLYNELTPSEKIVVDQHLSQCDPCSQLAREVLYSQAVIKNAAKRRPELRNPSVLTQRIMNAREKEEGKLSILSMLFNQLDGIIVRYSMGIISVILISFFIYEQQTEGNSAARKNITNAGTLLDYGKFMNAFVKQRDDKISNNRYSYYKSERIEKKM